MKMFRRSLIAQGIDGLVDMPAQLQQAAASAQSQQMTAMQQNMAARQALLTQGVAMRKLLGTFGPYSMGQQIQIPLDRMGVFTKLALFIQYSITIATATATASPFGNYPLVAQVKYTDFNAVDRVSTSGIMLYAQNCLRMGKLAQNAYTSQNFSGVGAIDTDQYFQQVAVAGPITNYFWLDVPLAYEPQTDLRGAVLAQTVVGDHYLKMTFCNAASADVYNAPYTSTVGNLTLNNIYVTVYEDYIQPQNLANLPVLDLSTIYGIEGNYISTANLQSATPFYINYPNNRSIMSLITIYENNGTVTLNGADLGEIDLIANANTQLRQESPISLRRKVRNYLGGDLPSGMYVIDSRKNPVATTLYGNVQAKFNVITANSGSGPTQFISQFEDFYPSGVPLPGVATGY